MDSIAPVTAGIHGDVYRLSELILEQHLPELSSKERKIHARRARSSLYGILLGKTPVLGIDNIHQGCKMSPISSLVSQRYILELQGKKEQSTALDQCIKQAFTFGWDSDPVDVLHTVISLTGTSLPPNSIPYHGPFHIPQLLEPISSAPHYPILPAEAFCPPPWMSIHLKSPSSCGYLTTFPFDKEPGDGLKLFQRFSPAESSAVKQQPLYEFRTITALTGPTELKLPQITRRTHLDDEGYVTPMIDGARVDPVITTKEQVADKTHVWSDALNVTLPELRTWETLGKLVTAPESPFLSCASSEALYHLSVVANLYHSVFHMSTALPQMDPQPVSRDDFVQDVLYLLTGIESHNFLYIEEGDHFIVRPGLWLDGYTVDAISSLCQDFIYCGTHFRRLERLSQGSSPQMVGGLMVQALRASLRRWTNFYRGAVLVLTQNIKSRSPASATSLFELLEQVQVLKQQVECLARLCCVSGGESLPHGVALLTHVYKEVINCSTQQTYLLFSVLKSCCEVYLRCLEKWIFTGDCSEAEHEEFFVHTDFHFSSRRDRLYWTRGFVLDKDAVPDFLHGLEVAIFDCGRAINLLRLCNPQHPLCILLEKQHPNIRCCLYKSDLQVVQSECKLFEMEAQRVCGLQMTVSKQLAEDQEQEAHKLIMMQKAQEERAIARANQMALLEQERAERRRKQCEDLRLQIFAAEQRKANEQERIRKEDAEFLENCQRQEKEANRAQEEEKQRLIAYYEELNAHIEKRKSHAEWQLKRLSMADKRQEYLRENGDHLFSPDMAPADSLSEISSSTVKSIPPTSVSDVNISSECSTKPSTDSVSDKEWTLLNEVVQSEVITDAKKSPNFKLDADSDSPAVKVSEEKTSSTHLREKHHENKESQDVSNEISSEKLCGSSPLSSVSELVKNRQRVLSDQIQEKEASTISPKQNEVLNSIVKVETERERNRRRVMETEFNIFTGESNVVTAPANNSNTLPEMNDLERNRRRVLGEEFDILTGKSMTEKLSARKSNSPQITESYLTDSGVVLEADKSEASSSTVPQINQNLGQKSGETFASFVDERTEVSSRPDVLRLLSGLSGSSLPPTPYSASDLPVFTSPFRGTGCLPNELPLQSPMMNTSQHLGNAESKVGGFPLMVDIMDSFIEGSGPATHKTEDEADTSSQITLNTTWLDSSLQRCLLLPLRTQHRYVSAALLHYFLSDLSFLGHLKSLRSYFFMLDGEFGRRLTVQLFSKMYQVLTPAGLLNGFTLNSLLKEALAGSQGASDHNRSRLSFSTTCVPHHFSHYSPNVLDCLHLSYTVPWPLNLLLTEEALEKYNMIFVFLVRLRRVIWLLQEDFTALKNTARSCFKEQRERRDLLNSPQYHQVQMIRHCMCQFVQATINYISSSVLHASWTDFEASLKQATTLDHLYNAHIDYVKRLLKRCMLNNNSKRLEAALTKVLACVLQFHSQLRVRPWQVPGKSADSQHLEHPGFNNLLSCFRQFKLLVSKLISYLERLVAPPNQQQHLAEYLLLLNLNGFYQSSDYLKRVENITDAENRS